MIRTCCSGRLDVGIAVPVGCAAPSRCQRRDGYLAGYFVKFRFSDYSSPFRVLEFRRLMREAPFWTADHLKSWSRTRRIEVLRHARETVPYYRESYDKAGIRQKLIGDDAEWLALPTITKVEIVGEGERLVSSAADRSAVWASTSGSTGMPMRMLLDRRVNAAAFALFWRAWTSGGYWRLGQKHAVMKGPSFEGVFRRHWKLRTLEIVSARVSSHTALSIGEALMRYGPRFMRGYPSSMYLFCKLLREQDVKLHLPMIVTGSEMLHDYQRAEFEAFLGARVFNHWTHWERSGSILECERGRLHAQEDYGHHEILDAAGNPVGPGIEGELTVTGLHNRSMPFIRYRTGDLAVWSVDHCACGQSFPIIDRIVGRETDFLYRSDGLIIPSSGVASLMKEWSGIRYAQLIQDMPGEIEVRVVKGREWSDSTADQIVSDLNRQVDGRIAISLRFCELEELERSPVGKLRQCFNRIPTEKRPHPRRMS